MVSMLFPVINKFKLRWLFFSLLCFLTGFYPLRAQGDLLITPRRVIFEGTRRAMDLNLANTGKDTATYAISMVQMRMTEDGGFEKITEPDPGQHFADKNIRFFPRTVTLGPGEAQVVKIQLYKQNELTPGEYRSHFYFRAVEDRKPLGVEERKDTTSISIVLKPIFGITIPAIIRVGEPTFKLSILDLKLKMMNDTVPNVSMVFNRSGDASVYGDLALYHVSSDGKETKIGAVNGIAIYTPNTIRKLSFNLARVPGINYTSGTLKAVFSSPSDLNLGKFAEASILLN
jgi:hypothetical protein